MLFFEDTCFLTYGEQLSNSVIQLRRSFSHGSCYWGSAQSLLLYDEQVHLCGFSC